MSMSMYLARPGPGILQRAAACKYRGRRLQPRMSAGVAVYIAGNPSTLCPVYLYIHSIHSFTFHLVHLLVRRDCAGDIKVVIAAGQLLRC
jgi:hypothetical protein